MVKESIKMRKILELSNIEKPIEHCTLNVSTSDTTFYRGEKKESGFTGFYHCEDHGFSVPPDGTKIFALYPTKLGPVIYYEGREYEINKNLNIKLLKNQKKRKFYITNYNIEINYIESRYIGFDNWSDEADVDLFFMIEQSYKHDSFYKRYTLE